jgi:hypothetical protein
MKKINFLLLGIMMVLFSAFFITACQKDTPPAAVAPTPPPVSYEYTEEFDDMSMAISKGWIIKNNSNPTGPNAWGQGRYENNLGGNKSGRVIGFPAFSASKSPFDFASVDATCVNNIGIINCWLISPETMVKDGDSLTFWTRAMNDQDWNNFAKDRMEVRANYVNGSANVGTGATTVGDFTSLLLNINPTMANNDPNGYPQAWRQYKGVVTGVGNTLKKARFAFRYVSAADGITTGGISGTNASSLIGIDLFKFMSK